MFVLDLTDAKVIIFSTPQHYPTPFSPYTPNIQHFLSPNLTSIERKKGTAYFDYI